MALDDTKDTLSMVSNDQVQEILHVFTDIETDSIQAKYLLQIAAVTQDGKQFNVFINPQRPLTLSITNFLGLYFYKNDLYRNGAKLNSIHVVDALKAFMSWIKKLKRPVMLAFHNGFAFDSIVLSNKLVYFKIEIPDNLLQIGDTLPFFRKVLKTPDIENHKLSTLAKHFDIDQDHAHDALSDSVTLKLICEKFMENNKIELKEIFADSTRNFNDYIVKFLNGTPLPKLKRKKKADKE